MNKNHLKEARKVLNKFLTAWKSLDYQAMYDNAQFTWSKSKSIDDVKKLFYAPISSFKILGTDKSNEVLVDYKARVELGEESYLIRARLIKERGAFMISKDGTFGVNPASIRIENNKK